MSGSTSFAQVVGRGEFTGGAASSRREGWFLRGVVVTPAPRVGYGEPEVRGDFLDGCARSLDTSLGPIVPLNREFLETAAQRDLAIVDPGIETVVLGGLAPPSTAKGSDKRSQVIRGMSLIVAKPNARNRALARALEMRAYPCISSVQRTRPKLRGSSAARAASASGRCWTALRLGGDRPKPALLPEDRMRPCTHTFA